MSIKQDIAKWEKAKKELAEVKKQVPDIARKIFPDDLKQEIENNLMNSLKAIFETM